MSDASRFRPPSESFLARLIATPISHLIRGEVTGSFNADRLIARAQLPEPVTNAIWRAVFASGLRRTKRIRLTTELIDLAGNGLAAGNAPDDVAAEVSESAGYLATVAGSMNARLLIARAQLPEPVTKAIGNAVQASRLFRMKGIGLATELIDLAGGALAAGISPDDVAAEVSERAEYLTTVGRFIPIGRLHSLPDRKKMPAEILLVLRGITDKLRGKKSERGEAVLAIYNRIVADLGAGASVETLTDRFSDPQSVALLVARPKRRAAVIDAALPGSLLQVVSKIVKGTRLWPSEKDDVARELCAHFSDGLTGGRTAAELATDFGSIETAAKLIRRAKKRNRPFAWHAARRGAIAMLVLVAFVAVLWGILALRYFNASPTIKVDYIAKDDARTSTIPVEDRAWPLYREGLLALNRPEPHSPHQLEEYASELTPLMTVLSKGAHETAGTTHPEWPRVTEYLNKHRKSLDLFIEASRKRDLGYIYRDRDNDDWLVEATGGSSAQIYGTVKPDYQRAIPQIHDLGVANLLLSAEIKVAIEQGNGTRAVDCLIAKLGIVDQIWRAENYLVTDLTAGNQLFGTSRQVRQILSERPKLLTDNQLVELAHRFASVCDGNPRIRYERMDRFVDDFLQNGYTDDGNGDGRLTPKGAYILLHLLRARVQADLKRTADWDAPYWQLESLGPLVATFSAGRREIGEKLHQIASEYVEDRSRPYFERVQSPMRSEFQRVLDSPSLRQRYLPAVLYWSVLWKPGDQEVAFESSDMALTFRDAALTVIALELHHRRTNQWPAKLEELVPRLLPSLPVDQFDGKPLRYRIDNDKPLLYSIGTNRIDDGGKVLAPLQPDQKTVDGDMVLFPTVPGRTH
ncbi:MAG: hypothetical protein AB7O26_01705 [Planctomycetaceae bacterium]